MGKPSPCWDVDILNEDGESCGVGEEGKIVVRTGEARPPGLFCGYYRDPELTSKVWHDGIYHTGDVAWRDEDGYFWYVGRNDDMIKSSGYRDRAVRGRERADRAPCRAGVRDHGRAG